MISIIKRSLSISATFSRLIDQLVPIDDSITKWLCVKYSPYKVHTKYIDKKI